MVRRHVEIEGKERSWINSACEWCETETKIKGYGEKKVLERGLENVTKSDGGLTRCRLEKLDEDKGLGRNSNLNLNGKKDFVVGLDGEEREETGPSPTSPSSSVSPTNMTDKSLKSSTMNERKIRKIIRRFFFSSDIYVSIYDPAGQAFVPSKTKPLPKWMSLLPNNVHREREETEGDTSQKKSQAAVSRAKLPEAYADGASSSHSDDCQGDHGPFTSCPTEEAPTEVSPRVHSGQVTPKDRLSFRERANSASESTSDSTRRPSASTLSSLALPSPHQKACKTTRPRSVSIEEKLPRPHQHPASAYRRTNRSSTIESACIKPKGLVRIIPHPEHTPRDVSERPLTPYPKIDSPDPFQTQHVSSSSSTTHPNSKPTLLHSPSPTSSHLERALAADSAPLSKAHRLGQVAQNVKEEKERKRAETQIQTEWNWLDHESKIHTPNAIVEQDANAQVGGGRSSRRNRGVSEDEVGRLSRGGSRMSGRRRRGTSGEERGQASRVGSRKEREREREREKMERDRLEKGDSRGKGKEKLVEEEESRIKAEDDVGGGVDESREQLKRELKGLFGKE
ncbi:uncharacterized protein EAF02_006777 [Botrytis sinoallii]|uniref:uncharacterized protein n=1 Tax=Botrytis sinoallii TaxID=1463999 RepID=UPI0019020BBB|nr:uncharacterized protein EAF02_006777 [Botrytis sinoallii]KAF7880886.1 hypothetical protein EAF02_006777 [Botrytis sinoallii]